MAKTTFQWVRDDEEQLHFAPDRPTRRQKRSTSTTADKLSEALIVAPKSLLKTLPLSEDAHDALLALHRIRPGAHGARKRQLLTLSAVLRDEDQDALSEALGLTDDSRGVSALDVQLEAAEHWRTRLIADGDSALTALLSEHPSGDRQRLRQLMNNARRDESKQRRGKSYKALFAALRELLADA